MAFQYLKQMQANEPQPQSRLGRAWNLAIWTFVLESSQVSGLYLSTQRGPVGGQVLETSGCPN